jgi:hypothetical protein
VTSSDALRVVLAVTWLLAGLEGPGATAQEASAKGRVPPKPVDYDLRGIRNIFQYADETLLETGPGGSPSVRGADGEPAAAPSPPSRVRLVGLVERVDTMVAALAVDGEVVLLGEGDSAGGFTVVELSEEAVVLRTSDGERQTLLLP